MMYNYILVYSNNSKVYRYYNLKDKTTTCSYGLHQLLIYVQDNNNFYAALSDAFNYETIEYMVNNGNYKTLIESTVPITPKYYPELSI